MPAPGSGCQDIAAPWLVADQKRFIKGNNWWEVSSNEFPVSGVSHQTTAEHTSSSGMAGPRAEGRSLPLALGEPGRGT